MKTEVELFSIFKIKSSLFTSASIFFTISQIFKTKFYNNEEDLYRPLVLIYNIVSVISWLCAIFQVSAFYIFIGINSH